MWYQKQQSQWNYGLEEKKSGANATTGMEYQGALWYHKMTTGDWYHLHFVILQNGQLCAGIPGHEQGIGTTFTLLFSQTVSLE